MTGEELGHFLQRSMAAGALDVYYTPITMKKNRPAYQITLLCRVTEKEQFSRLLLAETSTFGIRVSKKNRIILKRKFTTLPLKEGNLKVKCGYYANKLIKVTPEFESVKQLSQINHISYMEMYRRSLAAIQISFFD